MTQPKTPLGEKLMSLRNQAIAKGMTLLSAEEITGEAFVLVRREDLEMAVKYLFYKNSLPLVGEDRDAGTRLKAALERKEGE